MCLSSTVSQSHRLRTYTRSPPTPICAVRALFSVHPSGASDQGSPQDEVFLFTPATLALFFAAAFVFLCLAYGIAAPTGQGWGVTLQRNGRGGGRPCPGQYCLCPGAALPRAVAVGPCRAAVRSHKPNLSAPFAPTLAGIFIPTMAIGAAMGRLCGRAVQAVLNGMDANLQVGSSWLLPA